MWYQTGQEWVKMATSFCCRWNCSGQLLPPPLPAGKGEWPHCNKNPIYVFLFWELRGLSPNFHIHVSVSHLYIPRIGPHKYFLQPNRQIDRGNRSQTHECCRTILFLEIFVSNFQYWFFAVHYCCVREGWEWSQFHDNKIVRYSSLNLFPWAGSKKPAFPHFI